MHKELLKDYSLSAGESTITGGTNVDKGVRLYANISTGEVNIFLSESLDGEVFVECDRRVAVALTGEAILDVYNQPCEAVRFRVLAVADAVVNLTLSTTSTIYNNNEYSRDTEYLEHQIEMDGENISYIGKHPDFGADTASSNWLVSKFTYSGSYIIREQVKLTSWDNRATGW